MKKLTTDFDSDAHRILTDDAQRIGIREHRNSWFQIVYFPPANDSESDTIKLRIEFRGSAIQGERFTSADLDMTFAFKDSHNHVHNAMHHPFAIGLHRNHGKAGVGDVTILGVHPSKNTGEPTTVYCRNGRQTSVSLGLTPDSLPIPVPIPIQGTLEYKNQTHCAFTHTTHPVVSGFGVGTSSAAWSFWEDPTVGQGLEGHYDLSIDLKEGTRKYMVQMSFFAKAKTASGYVLEMGTKEEPWCRLLPPFGAGAKVVGNPTELVLATIGKGLMKIAVSGRD